HPTQGLNASLANGRIVKLGIVSRNAAATGDALRAIFPTVPPPPEAPQPAFKVKTFTEYRGQRLDQPVDLGVANVFTENFWFEVLEPLGDTPNPWRDHLDAHGTSVCFVSIHVEAGLDDQAAAMANLGFSQIWFEEKGYERYSYFDTTDLLGFLVEVKEKAPH
ncbi:MAG: hypothetical protein LBU05_03805, partial [Bifidobacteriaceae bacterium]|nr:hypothetical protein [Bifidobacteriaceae bacterium]